MELPKKWPRRFFFWKVTFFLPWTLFFVRCSMVCFKQSMGAAISIRRSPRVDATKPSLCVKNQDTSYETHPYCCGSTWQLTLPWHSSMYSGHCSARSTQSAAAVVSASQGKKPLGSAHAVVVGCVVLPWVLPSMGGIMWDSNHQNVVYMVYVVYGNMWDYGW